MSEHREMTPDEIIGELSRRLLVANKNARTPGTIEVSEADYRRLVDERHALLKALAGAADYIECEANSAERDDPAGALRYVAQIRAAIKLAEGD